jgi:hypothetical protein
LVVGKEWGKGEGKGEGKGRHPSSRSPYGFNVVGCSEAEAQGKRRITKGKWKVEEGEATGMLRGTSH